MVPHQINDDGTCSTCDNAVTEKQFFTCYHCENKFHASCNGAHPFCVKSSIPHFKTLELKTFFKFVCPHCQTAKENVEASSTKEQLADLVTVVAKLVNEVSELKKQKMNDTPPELQVAPANEPLKEPEVKPAQTNAWNDEQRIKKVKEGVTLCIKSNGEAVDMTKVKEVVTKNGIQVSKTSVSKRNGDVYIDLPSDANRDKLIPLLRDETTIPGDRIVNVKQKCPTVSIKNVRDYSNENDFVETVKKQNSRIAEKIDAGSEFSVVFTREQTFPNSNDDNSGVLVVLRVANEIRDVIKESSDRIYYGTSVHRVLDRFYIKSCARCHKFGHYHAECQENPCCGYCMDENHTSEHCPVRKENDHSKFKCVNCKCAQKQYEGHSSHYGKCPTYLELQKRTKLNIPYYNTAKNPN